MMPIARALSCWNDRGLALVVYIGAGDGLVLEACPDPVARRLVLVEGDPDTAAELQARAHGRPGVEVLQAVVAPEAGRLKWHRFNLRMLNGPQESLGLMAFYPRLRQLGKAELTATSFDAVLAELTGGASTDPGASVLVLDVPGQEAALLYNLPQSMLQRFDGIVLRGCSLAVPGVEAAVEQAVKLLEQRLYRRLASFDDAEPLWPVHALAFDQEKARTQAVEQQLGALQAEVERLRSEAEEAAARAAEFERAMAAASKKAASDLVHARDDTCQALARTAELEQALAMVRSELANRDQQLASVDVERRNHEEALTDLHARLGAVSGERDEANVTVDKLRRQVALGQEGANALQACIDELRAQVQRQAARLEALQAKEEGDRAGETQAAVSEQLAAKPRELEGQRSELAAAQAAEARALEQLQAERTRLTAERDQATRQATDAIERLQQELADARQTASLSVKLQMLREADLRDLQQRYEASQAQQQSQHELLSKLAQRLSLANQYFQQLSHEQQTDELVDDRGGR